MKLKLRNSKIAMILFMLLNVFYAGNIFGQSAGDYRSKNTSTANWSALSTWDRYDGVGWATPTIGEGYPGENSGTGLVTITNHATGTVTLDVSPANTIGELAIGDADGVAFATLTYSSNEILNVTGNVTLRSAQANVHDKIINLDAGTLTIGGNLRIGTGNQTAGSNGASQSILNITSGTASIDGNLTLEPFSGGTIGGQAVINVTGSGTINLKGSYTLPYTLGTMTMSGLSSVFNYNGTSPQTVMIGASLVRYRNLSINNTSSGGATLSAAPTAITVAGNWSVGNINSGSLLNTNNFAVTLGASMTFTLAFGSTLDAGTSIIGFGVTGTANINGVFKTANTVGFSGTASTAIRSTNSPTINLGINSTIEYNAAGNQTVTIRTYENLALSNSGNKTIGNLTTINKNLSISGTAMALLTNGGTSTADTLTLGGSGQVSGSWGSTSSAATNTNNTYFTANTGIINVATSSCPAISAVISGTDAICNGSSSNFSVAITGGTGPYTVVYTGGGGGTVLSYTSGNNIPVSPTTTTTYTLVSVTDALSCPAATLSGSAVITVGITKTWSGSWAPSAPTSIDDAVISANYSQAAHINACTLTVNSGAVVVIPSTFNVTLNGALTVSSGSFTLNNNANLVQTTSASNSGNIIVKRNTNPLIRFDYTLWSSPVASQNLLAFSPLTTVSPTIRFYTYNTSTNLYNSVASPSTTPFDIGKGYLIRLPFNHPTAPAIWTGSFTGVPNNGTQTIGLTNIGVGQRFNAIGNPYPSTVDLAQFAIDNSTKIEPTLYYWRKTNNAASPSYCTWNTASNTFGDNGEAYTDSPLGILQVGQGFIVEALAGASTVEFNNDQRVANNANQFFRTTTTNSGARPIKRVAHRIWLNLTGVGSEFSQTVVGYFTSATQGKDAYDSSYFNDGAIALTSLINYKEYAIQGRALPFQDTDVVPLSYKVATDGDYTFTIDHVDGLFTDGTQDIFIKDNENTNGNDANIPTYHNLNNGPFTFRSKAGTFYKRFELVYTAPRNRTDSSLSENAVVVYKQNEELVLTSSTVQMKSVKVFDIRGRLLIEKSEVNANEIRLNVDATNQVVLVQITTTDNEVITKKVVN